MSDGRQGTISERALAARDRGRVWPEVNPEPVDAVPRGWVTAADVRAEDVEVLRLRYRAVQALLAGGGPHAAEFFECYGTGTGGRLWGSGCSCAACVELMARLHGAQTELEDAFRAAAESSGIADSIRSEGWVRLAAWFVRSGMRSVGTETERPED